MMTKKEQRKKIVTATQLAPKLGNRNHRFGCIRLGWVQFWLDFRSTQPDPQTLGKTEIPSATELVADFWEL